MKLKTFVYVVASLIVTHADAAKPEQVFRGQIVVLKKRPPGRFVSDAAFVKFIKAEKLKNVWPEKPEPAGEKKEPKSEKKSDEEKPPERWKLEYMAFLSGPANDLELKVKFFAIEGGMKRFVAADSVFLGAKDQRIVSSSMALSEPDFEINKEYSMLLVNARNGVLASAKFWLRGKPETYSGKVTFSDDETKGE